MPVVSNTSPVLNLAIIGQIDLLYRQFEEILIPTGVQNELKLTTALPVTLAIKQAREAGWLAELILELAGDFPIILEPLERLAARTGLQKEAPPTTSSQPQPPVDFNLLRRQIKAELRSSIQSGYNAWGGDCFYDSDLGATLEPALELAQVHLDAGEPRRALEILKAAAGLRSLWDDHLSDLMETHQRKYKLMPVLEKLQEK